jgi:hypothetical protein
VSVLVLVLMALLACVAVGPAASAKSDTTKFCDAVNNISDQIDSGPDVSDSSGLKSTAAALKNAAKSAPGSIKSSVNTMANFYSTLAGKSKGEAITALASGLKNYTKAAGKFTKFYVKNCVTLPTVTTRKGS